MEALWDWFRWLERAHGIDLTVFHDPFDRARFAAGLVTTLTLSSLCLVISLAIGVIGAWLLDARWPLVRRLVRGYIQAFRNTPPLVQLYFLYFGVGGLLPRLPLPGGGSDPLLGSMAWAVIALSLFAGAFNIEIFRSGIEAVPRPTIDAALTLGYDRFGLYWHVVLPLALRICLPALNNNLVNLVKTTTLAYAIGVPELLYVSAQIWADELNVREMMNLLLVLYVGIVGLLVLALNRLERAMKIPGLGS